MTIFLPEIIRKKRDKKSLTPGEIKQVIEAYTNGDVPDYQMSALLMAVFFNGLDDDELHAWADAMLHSGEVMDHSNVSGIKVDKHSTGGVGDKISICLAPAVAALGVPVPMISGRGLGHTGGTLDKLESIPGFNVNLSSRRSNDMLKDLGIFLIGQTDTLAPADKKLYALRDVTGTVESIPLIATSIMSKKLAEGIDALVLDVKVGEGAFMRNLKQARKLAHTLISVGQAGGKKVSALLTDMSRPIGKTVGNALEIKEAIEVMNGKGPADTVELTVELGAQMLMQGAGFKNLDDARLAISEVLTDGRALTLFSKVIERQDGDPDVCEHPNKLPVATYTQTVTAQADGYLEQIHPRLVAMAALEVGAGRRIKTDKVNPSTGVEIIAKIGDKISIGDPLAVLHHDGAGADAAIKLLGRSFKTTTAPCQTPALIIERM